MPHQRSKFDRLHREAAGQWLRLPDAHGTILADMCYFTVGSYDGTNQVITTTGTPVSLPTGTPAVPAGVKIYDRENATFSASDTGYAIRSVNVHTDGTHGQVDWVVIPTAAGNPVRIVTVYHSTLSNGEAVDPISTGRYFKGTLNTSDDIWIEAIDMPSHADVRAQLPAAAEFIGVYGGTYDPNDDDSEITSDERDLYRIQPPAPGVVLAMATATGTAASWTTTTAPTQGSVTCTLYNYTEAGALEVYKTSVSVKVMAESAIPAGSILYVGFFEGRWHVIAKMCEIASGYTA